MASHAEVSKSYLGNYTAYLKTFFYHSVLMTSAGYLLYWSASIYVSGLLLNTRISVGDFLVLINIVSTISMQIINVLQILPDLYGSSLYIDEIKEILDYPSDFHAGKYLKREDFHRIEFKDVDFKYFGQNRFALHNVSFTIEKNQLVAVVGLNGSGKSTVLGCLSGLLKPDGGTINLNNAAYNEYDTKSLRSMFGTVFQTYHIYEQSIADNLLPKEAGEEDYPCKIKEALQFGGLLNKAESLPNGIDTILSGEFSPDGICLSGGEQQKLARAYAANHPVLVMDEPSGNLDPLAENELIRKINQLSKDKGVILVTHNPAYVKNVDLVLYFENGCLLEQGPPNEVLPAFLTFRSWK